ETAGDVVARRPECRWVSRRRSRFAHRGLRIERSTFAWRRAKDRRRRQCRAGDRRLPRRKETRVTSLVFLEHHDNELSKPSLGVLSKAASLGDGDVAGVVIGEGVRAIADEAGKFGA